MSSNIVEDRLQGVSELIYVFRVALNEREYKVLDLENQMLIVKVTDSFSKG